MVIIYISSWRTVHMHILCLYIYIYIYIYIYTHTHTHTLFLEYMQPKISAHHSCQSASLSIYIYIYILTHIYIHTCSLHLHLCDYLHQKIDSTSSFQVLKEGFCVSFYSNALENGLAPLFPELWIHISGNLAF